MNNDSDSIEKNRSKPLEIYFDIFTIKTITKEKDLVK